MLKNWIAIGLVAGISAAAGSALIEAIFENKQSIDVNKVFNDGIKNNEIRLTLEPTGNEEKAE